MYKVKSKTKIIEVMTLDDAMKSAKEMNELETIEVMVLKSLGYLVLILCLKESVPMGQTMPGRSEDVKKNSYV